MCSRKPEHFKRYLQVHNINRLITVKTEFAPRNPHHNGKPFAASLVVQYRRLEILIKRIVWLGAELGSAKRQKRFFCHACLPIYNRRNGLLRMFHYDYTIIAQLFQQRTRAILSFRALVAFCPAV